LAKILIVDDQDVVVNVVLRAMQSLGHECTVARSGQQAVEAAQCAEKIDLLIVDHSVPPDRGVDIAKRILLRHPATRVLHMSGYLRHQVEAEESFAAQAGFIQKPFTVKQLTDAVVVMLGNDRSISQG
jgi:two-component system cell cycle sensor histidine kinase/response regulator CckA